FKAAEGLGGGDGLGDATDGGIAGAGHDSEDVTDFISGLVAAKAGPGDVVVDGAGTIELGPHIQQNEATGSDWRGDLVSRLVMRVGGVGIGADNRAVVGDQAGLGEAGKDELLDF